MMLLLFEQILLELTLIGSARKQDFLEKLNQMIKSNHKIKLINQIPHNQVWDYLENAHIGVLPVHDVDLFRYNTSYVG